VAADPANIARAMRRAQVVTRADPDLRAAVPSARDGSTTPDAGYFVSAQDASAALAVKAGLVGTFRRRFLVRLAEELEIDPLDRIPTFDLFDDELGFDGPALPTRIELNLEDERTTLEVMG
jgi:hypothetical protein